MTYEPEAPDPVLDCDRCSGDLDANARRVEDFVMCPFCADDIDGLSGEALREDVDRMRREAEEVAWTEAERRGEKEEHQP